MLHIIPCPPVQGQHTTKITELTNHIPNTLLVCWLKQFPHEPILYQIKENLNESIIVPSINKMEDLMGTHLELRIMSPKRDHCFIRLLLWEQHAHLCLACPNDQERNIDHLAFDLDSTKRIFQITSSQTKLSVHLKSETYFLQVNQHFIPIESVF